jgi:hypothetical protein
MFCFAWQNAPLGRPLFDSTYISFGSHDALIDHVLETHWSQRYRHLLRHPVRARTRLQSPAGLGVRWLKRV